MKNKLIALSFFFFSFLFLNAQESEPRINYSNITEFGFFTTSPRGTGFEATTVNGISINKKHNIGFGIGFGRSAHSNYYSPTAYTPLFLNYRLYFKPEAKFSPHINVALGGVLVKDGEGAYSSLTTGFRAGKFSFSSGISFMALNRSEKIYFWNHYTTHNYTSKLSPKWYYPFGITIKCGFSF